MQERRLYPRFPWACALELRGPQDGCHAAQSTDLSVTGIGLQLCRAGVVGLAQSMSILAPGDRLRILVSARRAGIPNDLDLACRVREVRRLSIDKYLIGTWFEKLDAPGLVALETLVDSARQRRWG